MVFRLFYIGHSLRLVPGLRPGSGLSPVDLPCEFMAFFHFSSFTPFDLLAGLCPSSVSHCPLFVFPFWQFFFFCWVGFPDLVVGFCDRCVISC